ncbi:DUF2799 domain-containing protein [Gallaecimonas xiamenensis]|uniref:DUF2799 domain-containing protein n=1 Tax=Gallaecimonas xiamenensis 3-C-1 TaxID=745411 RepID=K2JN45_9GAMM|nr:DUF2799 domain-containing protein [Gallaecimonas xiamenensis]EKE75912.1 hypothetical protein B3C1_05617 [Gallaecimonas xiamenensis 3-C-1]
MRVLILALAALLSGCAAVTAEQCATMNWHQQGVNDGFNGLVARSGYWLSQCREYDIGIDQSAYSQGWAQGNGQYCTPAQGYRHGSQGHSYQGVCQGPGLQAFLDSYQRGHQLFERNQYRQSLQNRQQELRRRMADLDRQLQTPYVPCTRQVAFSAPPARLQPSPAAPASKGVVGRLALEVAQKAKDQQGKPDKPGRPDQPGKPDKPGKPAKPCQPQGLDPQARRELLWQRQQLSDELMHLDDLLLELL